MTGPWDSLIRALREGRVAGGAEVEAWSLFVNETRRISLGIKDAETGNAHAPLNLGETCGARYLIVWKDRRISRGYLERRQLTDAPSETFQLAAVCVKRTLVWLLSDCQSDVSFSNSVRR